MNHGKSDVIKQEVASGNTDILEVNELKWTRMGKCNSDDYYIYYCGERSLTRDGVALIVNKSPKRQYLGASSKITE